MPVAAAKPCTQPKCGALQPCPDHIRLYDKRRPSAARRGYDARWRERRLYFLQSHPLCIDCTDEGRITPATEVDHIIPHRSNPRLMWDEANWTARCKPHHSRKTRLQDMP